MDNNCKMMGHSYHGFMVTLIVFVITLKSAASQEICAAPSEAALNRKLTALQGAFPQEKTKIDLVIILDRSRSISNLVYNESLTAVKHLFSYLINSGRLYVHENYARVALLSFGKTTTVEFEGISDGRTLDACDVVERLEDLSAQAIQEDSSQISDALSRAQGIFTLHQQQGVRQLLWIFFDGAVDDDIEYDMTSIELMRQNGVISFSAAIGVPPKGWMDTVTEENRVKGLAKDNDHSACVETWIELLAQNTPDVPQVMDSDKLYSELNADSPHMPGSCGDCQVDNQQIVCACDVIALQYGCYDCRNVEGCSLVNRTTTTSTTQPTTTTESSTQEDEGGLELWILIVIIAGSCLVVILAFISIIACCCCRNRQSSEEKSYEGPALPLPPRRKNLKDLHIMQDDPLYINSDTITMRTKEGIESDRQDEVIYMGRNSIMEEERQQNMEGWGEYLEHTASENNLKHLGIFNLDRNKESAAWTGGFKLSQNQLRQIDKALSHGSVYGKKGTIRVHEKSFIVDKETLSPLNMRAFRRPSNSRGKTSLDAMEEMHVSKIGNYLVVGVSSAELGDTCQQKVVEIRRHLENNIDFDNSNNNIKDNRDV